MNHNLDQYLENPNVRAFLAVIRDTEATSKGNDPYRVFGGSSKNQLESLDKTPDFKSWGFTQTDGKKNRSTATGAYQFLSSTWKELQKQYGFEDFTPRTQDLGAIALLQKNGALPFILSGDFDTAVKKANKTWASLPGSPYAQRTKDMTYVKHALERHLGEPVVLNDIKEEDSSPKPQAPTNYPSRAEQNLTQRIKTLWAKVTGFFRPQK